MGVHHDIIDFLVRLGYTEQDSGFCHGMALRWIEACLLGEEDLFEKRINDIVSHREQLVASIHKIRENNKNLKAGDKALPVSPKLLDILAFCDSLELYHHPHDHSSLFNKVWRQSNIDAISYFASSDRVIERGGLVQRIYSESVIYTQSEIEGYLDELGSMIESSALNEPLLKKKTFGMVLSSYNHVIAMTYQQGGGWKFMDINQYPSKSFGVNQSTEIAELIVNGFKGNSYTPFNINMVSLGNNSQLLKLKRLLKQFKESHVLTKEIASRVDDNNISLAYIAAENGSVAVIAELVKHGADLNIVSKDGFTLAYIAAENGHTVVIAELARNGVDVNIANNGITPAFIASQQGYAAVIAELAKHGADLNIASKDGFTPAFIAAQEGYAAVIAELAKGGADLNTASEDDFTPAYIAAYKGYTDVIAELAKHGADLNLACNGVTPAYIVAENGHAAVIVELAKCGADVNIACNGFTPAYIAAQEGHAAVIVELAKCGADVNIACNGVTPAYIAAQEGHAAVIAELAKCGADLNIAFNTETPAYIAAQNGHVDVIAELVKHGADINIPFTTLVDGLIEFASPKGDSIRNRMKQFIDSQPRAVGSNAISITPYDIAVIMGHDKLVTVFSNYNLIALTVR